ncbi:MAG: GAF domain-containing protein [Synechococcales cyanobacterium M58_A2018_015]|nr:GAF domain-containing protein [Synechococcales cyanobacterium M58_A2018_015]
MSNRSLLLPLQSILANPMEPSLFFPTLLPVLGELLQCDRCFLYLRNPNRQIGKVTHCWRRTPDFPDLTESDWQPEPAEWQEDPLFVASVRAVPSIYIEDVETASPEVVNREFERRYYGHRALVHAHLCSGGQLWGVLQPCMFGQPRVWSEFDRSVITQVTARITPLAIEYVQAMTEGIELPRTKLQE